MITVLSDRSEIEAAEKGLSQVIAAVASAPSRLTVGFQGGTRDVDAYWCEPLNMWASFHNESNRFWNAFGLDNPFQSKSSASITVEVNPPIHGIDRRIQGAFGRDNDGELYLLHRGGVGGGKKGIGKTAFLAYYDRIGALTSVADGDQQSPVLVVAALGDPLASAQIAAFVRSVATFKAEAPNLDATPLEAEAEISYTPEFTGIREIPARERLLADCRHGAVVDQLRLRLEAAGHAVGNDLRDLFIHRDGRVSVVFEVKTLADRRSIYEAIGQLVFHTRLTRARRVAVLPKEAHAELAAALHECGIETVLYDWTGAEVRFTDMTDIALSTKRKNDR